MSCRYTITKMPLFDLHVQGQVAVAFRLHQPPQDHIPQAPRVLPRPEQRQRQGGRSPLRQAAVRSQNTFGLAANPAYYGYRNCCCGTKSLVLHLSISSAWSLFSQPPWHGLPFQTGQHTVFLQRHDLHSECQAYSLGHCTTLSFRTALLCPLAGTYGRSC